MRGLSVGAEAKADAATDRKGRNIQEGGLYSIVGDARICRATANAWISSAGATSKQLR